MEKNKSVFEVSKLELYISCLQRNVFAQPQITGI